MLKMVCDKCGKAVLTTSVEAISIRERITILDRQYDLCRECKLKVMMFIDGKMPYEECEDCETHLTAQTEKKFPRRTEKPIRITWVDEDLNALGKTEPQTNCDTCKYDISEDDYDLYDICKPMVEGECKYEPMDEPQTDGYMTAEQAEDYRKMLDKAEHNIYGNIEDEPQTERSE